MNSIKSVFERKKQNNEKTNIGYVVAGYPSVDFTKNFLSNLDKTSIDILEIGIPYSDPLADGKLISEASFKASQSGVTTDTVFELLKEVKDKVSKPLVFLVYYNLIFSYGIDNFLKKCTESNIQGLIIPDLPYEESKDLYEKATENSIDLIPLVSVTSQDRISKISSHGSGFVYAIGSLGVTGSKQVDLPRLEKFIENIRTQTNLPVSLGFGIKNNNDVKRMRQFADGVIIGTSIVDLTTSNNLEYTISEINKFFE